MGSLKPGNFFLALSDFLAVFVPGAVLLFVLLDVKAIYGYFDDEFGFSAQSTPTQLQSSAAFFFGAYFLGHVVYHMGSWILGSIYEEWIKRDGIGFGLGKHRSKAKKTRDSIRSYLHQNSDFHEFRCNDPKESNDSDSYDSIWRFANCVAGSESDFAANCLERTRSESRFFRSITVVSFILFIIFIFKGLDDLLKPETHYFMAVLCLLALFFSFIRFAERRLKHETETYNHFIAVVDGPWKNRNAASTEKDRQTKPEDLDQSRAGGEAAGPDKD